MVGDGRTLFGSTSLRAAFLTLVRIHCTG